MRETRSYSIQEVLESDRLKASEPLVDRPREFWSDMEQRIIALGYTRDYARREVEANITLALIGPTLGISADHVRQALLEAVDNLEMQKALGF
jgi:DNA-directed RNA polymerase sigma subunit (sigma70/sigma32)